MKKIVRNINRVWATGVKKSFRMLHIFLPLVLFFTLVITLSSCIIFSYGLSTSFVKDLSSKLNIVVYFNDKASTDAVEVIAKEITNRPDVFKTEYISSGQALDAFKQRHANDGTFLKALDEIGDNPFGPSLVIYARDTANYKDINTSLQKINDKYSQESILPIEDISYDSHSSAIEKFANMVKKGQIILGLILFVMAFVLLFITYLALRFATQGDRDEIKIMKLVGASNSLIVGPTAVMGMLSGIFGAILSLIILYFISLNVTPYTLAFSGFNMLTWYTRYIQYFILGNITFGMLIGFVGSIFAIRRHL